MYVMYIHHLRGQFRGFIAHHLSWVPLVSWKLLVNVWMLLSSQMRVSPAWLTNTPHQQNELEFESQGGCAALHAWWKDLVSLWLKVCMSVNNDLYMVVYVCYRKNLLRDKHAGKRSVTKLRSSLCHLKLVDPGTRRLQSWAWVEVNPYDGPFAKVMMIQYHPVCYGMSWICTFMCRSLAVWV